MSRQSTRAELANALLDIYEELQCVHNSLWHIISEESGAKTLRAIKENARLQKEVEASLQTPCKTARRTPKKAK